MRQNELKSVLGEIYYLEAVRCARSSDWGNCRQYLRGMSSLLRLDHRAPVLQAKVLLREGHLEASLTALQVAKDLGHDPYENEQMASFILGLDEQKYARLKRRVARRKFVRTSKRATKHVLANTLAETTNAVQGLFSGLNNLSKKKKPQASLPGTEIEEQSSDTDKETGPAQSMPNDQPSEVNGEDVTRHDPNTKTDTTTDMK